MISAHLSSVVRLIRSLRVSRPSSCDQLLGLTPDPDDAGVNPPACLRLLESLVAKCRSPGQKFRPQYLCLEFFSQISGEVGLYRQTIPPRVASVARFEPHSCQGELAFSDESFIVLVDELDALLVFALSRFDALAYAGK